RDHPADIALEDVRPHPGDVTDVVTHIVGDRRRVARIVLRDPRLDLTDQVGSDIGGLRVDPATDTGEEGDRARAHREPADDLREVQEVQVTDRIGTEEEVPSTDPYQTKRRDGEPHYRTTEEGHSQR